MAVVLVHPFGQGAGGIHQLAVQLRAHLDELFVEVGALLRNLASKVGRQYCHTLVLLIHPLILRLCFAAQALIQVHEDLAELLIELA